MYMYVCMRNTAAHRRLIAFHLRRAILLVAFYDIHGKAGVLFSYSTSLLRENIDTFKEEHCISFLKSIHEGI
jgi:hypothetical protein